ncbi:hypothetical protein DAI22_05g130000 [Oryza sativa Japonica Group]|nr:hypothetical protein DAI22_05g130000 [Oryza sativa Japonica Group]
MAKQSNIILRAYLFLSRSLWIAKENETRKRKIKNGPREPIWAVRSIPPRPRCTAAVPPRHPPGGKRRPDTAVGPHVPPSMTPGTHRAVVPPDTAEARKPPPPPPRPQCARLPPPQIPTPNPSLRLRPRLAASCCRDERATDVAGDPPEADAIGRPRVAPPGFTFS